MILQRILFKDKNEEKNIKLEDLDHEYEIEIVGNSENNKVKGILGYEKNLCIEEILDNYFLYEGKFYGIYTITNSI